MRFINVPGAHAPEMILIFNFNLFILFVIMGTYPPKRRRKEERDGMTVISYGYCYERVDHFNVSRFKTSK